MVYQVYENLKYYSENSFDEEFEVKSMNYPEFEKVEELEGELNPFIESISEDTHYIDSDYIIDTTTFPYLFFNEKTCKYFYQNSLYDDSKRELIQAYILIKCLESIGLNIHKKSGEIYELDKNFKNILSYKEVIQKSLGGNVSLSEVMNALSILKMDIIFSEKDILYISDVLFFEILKELDASREYVDKDIIFINDNVVVYQKNVCLKYLKNAICKASKRELTQAVFMFKYMKYFNDSLKELNLIIGDSINHINKIEDKINEYLEYNITEFEINEYIKILKKKFNLYDKECDVIFDELSVLFNAKEDKEFLNNEIIVTDLIYYEEDQEIISHIDFDERIYKKQIQKKENNDMLRELTQAYFLGQIIKNYQGVLLNHKKEKINFSNSLLKSVFYSESIFKKIEGLITEDFFDQSLRHILRSFYLTEQDNFQLYDKVLYPIKVKLGFEAVSPYRLLI